VFVFFLSMLLCDC